MPKRPQLTPADFTVAELEAMLAAKTETEKLEAQRGELRTELAAVEKKIDALVQGLSGKRPVKKTAKKRVSKKAGGKESARAAKASVKKAAPKSRITVESVVIDLLTKAGEPMAFKDILATIQKKKLVKTKSKDFGNVLRRTLSTSEKVKRVSRGVYCI